MWRLFKDNDKERYSLQNWEENLKINNSYNDAWFNTINDLFRAYSINNMCALDNKEQTLDRHLLKRHKNNVTIIKEIEGLDVELKLKNLENENPELFL